jgi:3-hydroxyisobutyrate dehydrogenase
MQVGFIGLGAMGFHMARNLAKEGIKLLVWNRTHCKTQKFQQQNNIHIIDSLNTLAAQADVIFICVSADEDVLEVIHQLLEKIQPQTIVVDSSTISSQTAKKATILLASKQAYYLDAPVSGGVEGAKKGTLAMMVGGDESVLKKITPLLKMVCTKLCYMGSTGAGQATKAVNQIMAAGINQAVTEALAFAQAEGLPMEKVIDIVSSGAAGNWFLDHRGLSMVKNEYDIGFKVKLHHKDLKICQVMAKNNAVNLNLVNKTIGDYEQLIEQGSAEEDISSLFRLKKQIV